MSDLISSENIIEDIIKNHDNTAKEKDGEKSIVYGGKIFLCANKI